jgi:hypothetical protein
MVYPCIHLPPGLIIFETLNSKLIEEISTRPKLGGGDFGLRVVSASDRF